MSILHLADCPPRPWKNGLGRTRELAAHPPGAGMEAFDWRVSVAEVTAAASFSAYPGVDRVIALLDGDGFTMHLGDGREHALTTPCSPFAFAGEVPVTMTLAGQPGRDFNLMLRRGRVRGGIAVWRAAGTQLPGTDTVLVYCARGRIDSAESALAAGDAWRPGHGALTLHADSVALVVQVMAAR